MYDTLKERFLKYVKIETRSNDESETGRICKNAEG